MAIGKIGKADAVTADSGSAARERATLARENSLNFGEVHVEKNQPRNKKVDEVAKMYEKQFLGEMMKAMRGTVSESEFTKPSMAQKIYRDQMDDQYVDQWGDSGGIGLSEVIYDQIMQKYFAQNADSKMELKQQGPMKLSSRDVSRVSRMNAERPNQTPLKVELAAGDGSASHVNAPWAGTLLTQTRLPDGKSAVVLDHGKGLRSTLIFEGVPNAMKSGQKIDQGAAVGVLSPEINSFFWNLNQGSDLG